MLITAIDSLPQLPVPALGLFPAVHNANVVDVPDFSSLPTLSVAVGNIYRNSGSTPIILPAGGAFPTRNLYPSELFSSNGVVFFKVIRKMGFTRQVTDLTDNVFTTPSPHGMIDGVDLKLAGFKTPIGFSNDTLYYVVESTSTTFKISTTQGGSALAVSVGVAGWLHTQSTNSFYPYDFNRPAYLFPFTLQSFPIGASFNFSREFSFRSVGAVTTAVWSVIFEFGERMDDTSPAPIGPNIEGYNWLPPALEQQVFITDLATTHNLGIVFRRLADGTIDGKRLLYSKALNLIPGTTPKSNDFMLRIRIGQFDTEDTSDLRGYVAYYIKLPNP